MDANAVLQLLDSHRSDSVLTDMGPRYGIHTASAIGVSMADMKVVAKQVGKDHELAVALWATGVYEARTVAALVDVADAVTATQMDAWCHDFDNWAICDTACFNLFDRTSSAWQMVDQWAGSDEEFVKRAAFALLWSLALHDKGSADEPFLHGLDLITRESGDGRNLVTKAIAMALRAIARRNAALKDSSVGVAEGLAGSASPAARRIGRQALKEMSSVRG